MKRKSLLILFCLPLLFFLKFSSKNRFQFAVFGDNQGTSYIFKKIIDELSILKPDFIISTGDMIPGYFEDTLEIKNAWKDFKREIKNLKVSFYPVPGNRDIWDNKSKKIYLKEWGKDYYSFEYKNSLLIILNTEEEKEERNSIKGEQFEWLKRTLERYKFMQHKFIFLHRPLWLYKNSNWMKEVHPLLLRYKVKAVFSGHLHLYCFNEIDNIKYIITGGAGKHLSLEEEKGGFNHYLLVRVEEESLSISVIRPGNILQEDVVIFENIEKDIIKVLK